MVIEVGISAKKLEKDINDGNVSLPSDQLPDDIETTERKSSKSSSKSCLALILLALFVGLVTVAITFGLKSNLYERKYNDLIQKCGHDGKNVEFDKSEVKSSLPDTADSSDNEIEDIIKPKELAKNIVRKCIKQANELEIDEEEEAYGEENFAVEDENVATVDMNCLVGLLKDAMIGDGDRFSPIRPHGGGNWPYKGKRKRIH